MDLGQDSPVLCLQKLYQARQQRNIESNGGINSILSLNAFVFRSARSCHTSVHASICYSTCSCPAQPESTPVRFPLRIDGPSDNVSSQQNLPHVKEVSVGIPDHQICLLNALRHEGVVEPSVTRAIATRMSEEPLVLLIPVHTPQRTMKHSIDSLRESPHASWSSPQTKAKRKDFHGCVPLPKKKVGTQNSFLK